MRCKDFLALHSDFRDGIITDPSMERRMRRHQARCRSCGKYVDALDLGTQVLREGEIEPSPRFRVNLRVRMALAQRPRRQFTPVFGWPARAAATLLVVTVVAAALVQKKHPTTGESAPRSVASTAPAQLSVREIPRPAPPEFHLPAFHQLGQMPPRGAPRVTFTIREDTGAYAVPATFTR